MAQITLRKLTAVLVVTILAGAMLSITNCEGDTDVSETPDNTTPEELPADPNNFHIYLCFGQSNMEGYNGAYLGDQKIKDEDLGEVDSRFQLLAAVDMPDKNRLKDAWSTATPPLCRANTGLCPADYFGRTLAANLPKRIKVGVINVSIGGCKIEAFDKDTYQEYLESPSTADWLKEYASFYGSNPYGRLVELAKLAQKDGVIKGILMHQGESNSGESNWPQKVKAVYDNLVNDLELDASTPFLAGQLVGGGESGMNGIILRLPQTLPSARVIRADGLPNHVDGLHFTPEGYRELGKRYAKEMLDILGYPLREE
jgi:alpha-L-fucosidase 2